LTPPIPNLESTYELPERLQVEPVYLFLHESPTFLPEALVNDPENLFLIPANLHQQFENQKMLW